MSDAAGDNMLGVIVVNYRTPDLALACIGALEVVRQSVPNLRCILVDGGSGDGSSDTIARGLEASESKTWVQLLSLEFNGGFGWANNQAIRHFVQSISLPKYIYLVNPDATVERNAVQTLVEAMEANPHAAAAGSALVDMCGRQLGSAFRFPTIASEFFRAAGTPALERLFGQPPFMINSSETRSVDWVSGASVIFRTNALCECGLFDEGFFLYFEEVELMNRLNRAGWQTLYVPSSIVRHIGGAATGVADGASPARRLPAYWFASRRRFFTLLYGRRVAFTASLAWIAGLVFWRLRQAIGLGRASAHAPGELGDLIRTGLLSNRSDQHEAIGLWSDPPDQYPAWALRG
jgi:N-acetylglucosaminyl-diphospho-decaprenol L-rhamnosyltransferase